MAEIDVLKEYIDDRLKNIVDSVPKPAEEKYTLSEFINHQKNCNDPNCIACSALHEHTQNQKIQDTLDHLNDFLDKKLSERDSEVSACIKKCKSMHRKHSKHAGLLTRAGRYLKRTLI